MSEKHKLHNVRLDNEVWAAVKAMDCSLNQYLRQALLPTSTAAEDWTQGRNTIERTQVLIASQESNPDPHEIPGVSVGLPPKKEDVSGFPCRCVHTGCRGSKFTGTSKFQNLCDECRETGHSGDPRSCQICYEDSGPA